MMQWHHRTCTFCEASCGIRVAVADGRISTIEPDPDDPSSRGHICSKAFALAYLQDDPHRLRSPRIRTPSGWRDCSWDEAFELAGERLGGLQRDHGRDAVALFLGNPVGQNFGTGTFSQMFEMALGSRNYFTSCSLDQNPAHAAALSLFGNVAALGVPDVDRTDCFVAFGANPVVSNGSLMTAPGFRRRASELRDRGGVLWVVDPRRTETAEIADGHLAIRPGGDPWLLAWLVGEVLRAAPDRAKPKIEPGGIDAVRLAVSPFDEETVRGRAGLSAAEIRTLRDTLIDATRPVVYGRIGLSHQPHSSLASWLLVVLNVVLGALDRPGGLMFPTPAIDLARFARGLGRTGGRDRWRSSVRGIPEFNGELPAGAFAEEVLDAVDERRIRGLVSLGANIARAVPGSRRVEEALEALEFFVAIDFYENATTRHADLILPPTTPAQQSNYPGIPYALAVRNVARWSAPTLPCAEGELADWEILRGLQTAIAKGRGDRTFATIGRVVQSAATPDNILAAALRAGPHDVTLAKLQANPSGVDLGPLEPRLGDVMHGRPDGVRLADPRFLDALERLRTTARPEGLVLIGRRHPRSNNSWFDRYEKFRGGRRRTELFMHPGDAAARELSSGQRVVIAREDVEVGATLHVTDEIRIGVVSLPHGWDAPNYNELSAGLLDELCGNAVFTGFEVTVRGA